MTNEQIEAERALLPCPMCGGEGKLFGGYSGGAAAINCTFCDAYGPSVMGKDAAIAAWNRRPAPAQGALTDADINELFGVSHNAHPALCGSDAGVQHFARAIEAATKAQRGGVSDAARLDFVMERSAFICILPAGSNFPAGYQLMEQDADEDYQVISGEGIMYRTTREAIDAAIAAIQAQAGDVEGGNNG